MPLAIFIFNVCQLLLIAGAFYYVIFVRAKKKVASKGDDDEGGLLYELWPTVILPPIDGIDYPSQPRDKEPKNAQ